jgi:hypothetical protein
MMPTVSSSGEKHLEVRMVKDKETGKEEKQYTLHGANRLLNPQSAAYLYRVMKKEANRGAKGYMPVMPKEVEA